MNRKIRKAKIISFASFSALLLDDPTGGIFRELWWTNQDFSRRYNYAVVLHAHISPGG
jgi:hypothetical protein